MQQRDHEQRSSERGAVLVHVALALLAITGFTTFVIDYGVFWESRRQAQNSADAGALGAAVALVGARDFTANGPAKESALAMTQANRVWGVPPSVVKATDITFMGPGHGIECPPNPFPDGDCVRVDVYRTAARSNAVPMFFGSLVGLTGQDVRATAVAKVIPANASDCLAPIAILDKNPTYTLAADLGTPLTLKDDQNWPGQSSYHGFLTFGGNGASAVGNAIQACLSGMHYIGEDITSFQKQGNSGGVKHSVDELVELDPTATWDSTSKSIVNSCAANGTCYKYVPSGNGLSLVPDPGAVISPRVIALPVVDLAIWNATQSLKIVNFLGFFVIGTSGNGNKDIDGILVTEPGALYSGGGAQPAPGSSAFLNTVALIR